MFNVNLSGIGIADKKNMLCGLLSNKKNMEQIFREFGDDESLLKFRNKFITSADDIINEMKEAETKRWKVINQSTEILEMLKQRGLCIEDLTATQNINHSRCLDTSIPIKRQLTEKIPNLGTTNNPKYNCAYYDENFKVVCAVHRLEPSSLPKAMKAAILREEISAKDWIHNAKQLYIDLNSKNKPKPKTKTTAPTYLKSKVIEKNVPDNSINNDEMDALLKNDNEEEGESQLLFIEPIAEPVITKPAIEPIVTPVVEPAIVIPEVVTERTNRHDFRHVVIQDFNVTVNTDKKICERDHLKAIKAINQVLLGKMNMMKIKRNGDLCLTLGKIRVLTSDRITFRIMDIKTFNKL